MYYEGKTIEFVPNLTYLGVIMQTKGGYSGPVLFRTHSKSIIKRKRISACTRIALRLPLTTMSLKSLERLLCTVILPSSMYGLALHESQMNEDDFQYLDVVQGRLIKAWFGVSKFCSTTALREAIGIIGWKLASEVVVCHLRHGVRMGSFVEGTQSMPFGKNHVRRCVGMWLSNGLHHLWCETRQCNVAREECTCKFCGFAGVDKCHLLTCEWACSIPSNRDIIIII